MANFYLKLFLIVCSLSLALSEGPFGKRVLVLLESSELKTTHSIFWRSLEERGYELTFEGTASSTALRKYGDWQYDNLILFAPSVDELEGISEKDILDFVDEGHNLLVATDSNIGSLVASIASECNVEFDEKDSYVVDHLHFDISDYDGEHTLLVADNVVESAIIVGEKGLEAPLLWRGVGQDIEEDSSLLFPVLYGYPTTYSHSEGSEELHAAGKKTVLVSALQARNNARVVFSGSLDLFSDKFFNSPVQKYNPSGSSKKFDKSGNEQFCKQLVRWTFNEKGILRVKNVEHHLVGETQPPSVYRIKDEIDYSIEIEEWKGKKWVPYNADDIQLEFIRLDPYVRLTLKSNGSGKFSTRFNIPDIYGIFTFKVEYSRKGYSHLDSIVRVPVRPFRHNEYERFIEAAYPYYASALSMIVGLFVFSWFFLYHREKNTTATLQK